MDTKTSNDENIPQEFSSNPIDDDDISLGCMSRRNCLRRAMISLTSSKLFENTILLLICLSSLQLAFTDPLQDPNDPKIYYSNITNLIFTSVFLIELICKIIAFGLICNGPKSYLRDNW